MRSHQLLLPLGLLLIALGVPSFAQNAEETLVEVAEGAPLAVECELRVEQRAAWRRDGGSRGPALPIKNEKNITPKLLL